MADKETSRSVMFKTSVILEMVRILELRALLRILAFKCFTRTSGLPLQTLASELRNLSSWEPAAWNRAPASQRKEGCPGPVTLSRVHTVRSACRHAGLSACTLPIHPLVGCLATWPLGPFAALLAGRRCRFVGWSIYKLAILQVGRLASLLLDRIV